ncbi:MAG: Xaa-Pro aminopeptidase [Colwellia sp.]|nr:Xaa-Pro aminopeptidase [Colwellia sp.]MCW8865750.1 Xaa-Pro aminopeptidase [Colwellia sp.]MCW9081697.1 Xaa-Pro aminopeptidase [Colwellia sp.]
MTNQVLPGIAALPMSEFVTRRKKFFAKMADNSVAFFNAAKEVTRSNDTEYAFCQNKTFYYLTGFNEPDAMLLLIKKSGCEQSILFSLPKDKMHEIWHGRRIGQEKACQHYQFDQCFTLEEQEELVAQYLAGMSQVYFAFDDEKLSAQIFTYLAQVRAKIRQGVKVPAHLTDASPIVDDLRLIKSHNEIELMRQVNFISGLAHQRAMQKTKAGLFEYQIENEILHEFARHGARYAAYATIVAGGDNANILHYTDNDESLVDNDLLLIDAGGELSGYAADITRTFPVSGKFTEPQKVLYQLVLDAKNQVLAAIKPGVTFAKLNDIANACLTKGLFDLGIITGDLAELIAERACKKYFIHGLGHWLGLDVHDVGDYHINDNKEQCREFAPGMVLTIEPGLYMPLDDMELAKQWRGIGIRIEDNIVVTQQGYENLTVNTPETIADIEALMEK